MVAILMMSAKMAILDLVEINVFWNNCYDVMDYVYDATKIYHGSQITL